MRNSRQRLRSLLLLWSGLVATAPVVAAEDVAKSAEDAWIKKIYTAGGMLPFDRQPVHWVVNSFHDEDDAPRAICFVVIDPFDPNVPGMQYRTFPPAPRQLLVVQGKPFHPTDKTWVFANGPYGATTSFILSPAGVDEFQELTRRERPKPRERPYWLEFWRQRIEPKLYLVEGVSRKGERHGKWAYRTPTGEIYMEMSYHEGLLSGEVRNYYPDGKLQAVREYAAGKPAGHWRYYDSRGELTGGFDWSDVLIPQSTGNSSVGTHRWAIKEGRRTGFSWNAADGGRFFIDGIEINTQ